MTDTILQELKRELTNGYSKRNHPFRYFTLATINNKQSRLRTVVLRKFLPDFTMIVYTDLRSQKVKDLKEDNSISTLFYHPKKLLQLSIQGKAEIITDESRLKVYWANVSENAKKDYTTQNAPGTVIKNPDNVSYDEMNPHFCVLKIKPVTIEYLQLKRPNHIRVLFKKEQDNFTGEFLVP